MNSMRIKTESWSAYGQREEEVSTFCEASGQFGRSLLGSVWVQAVAISAKADMFSDMQTRNRFKGIAFVRHLQDATFYALNVRHIRDNERPNIYELHLCNNAEQPDEVHTRADIDVDLWLKMVDLLKRPNMLIEIMTVNGCLGCSVKQAWVCVAKSYRLGAVHLTVPEQIPQIRGILGQSGKDLCPD